MSEITIRVVRSVRYTPGQIIEPDEVTEHTYTSEYLASTTIKQLHDELVPPGMFMTDTYNGRLITDTGGLWTGFNTTVYISPRHCYLYLTEK